MNKNNKKQLIALCVCVALTLWCMVNAILTMVDIKPNPNDLETLIYNPYASGGAALLVVAIAYIAMLVAAYFHKKIPSYFVTLPLFLVAMMLSVKVMAGTVDGDSSESLLDSNFVFNFLLLGLLVTSFIFASKGKKWAMVCAAVVLGVMTFEAYSVYDSMRIVYESELYSLTNSENIAFQMQEYTVLVHASLAVLLAYVSLFVYYMISIYSVKAQTVEEVKEVSTKSEE